MGAQRIELDDENVLAGLEIACFNAIFISRKRYDLGQQGAVLPGAFGLHVAVSSRGARWHWIASAVERDFPLITVLRYH